MSTSSSTLSATAAVFTPSPTPLDPLSSTSAGSAATSGSAGDGKAAEGKDDVCGVCQTKAKDRCGKCKTVYYCSREHQVKDWQAHKAKCKSLAAKSTSSSSTSGTKPSSSSSKPSTTSPFASSSTPETLNFGGQQIPIRTVNDPDDFFNVFPKNLPKKEAYGRLIDCFRLWCDDAYAWNGEHYGIYNQESPHPEFARFLRKARPHLPSWWTDADTKATIKMSKTDEHYNVEFAQEKSDINEHYDNPAMAMTMRMWTEKVTGMRIGGFGGL